VYCDDPANNRDEAEAACNNYVTSNDASLLDGYPTFSGNTITVGTTITADTFLASAIGQDQITVKAQAKAGCSAPCLGEGVLPVVWTCKPDAVGSPPGSKACEDLPIPWDQLVAYRDHPGSTPGCQPIGLRGGNTGYICPELTIVMDNLDIDGLQCKSAGGYLDCDFNGDGRDDYVSADNRGWADLDGNVSAPYSCDPTSEGAAEQTYWIEHGYECPFEIHTWVGDQPGNNVNLYHTVEERRKTNPIVVLPVFDDSCPTDPTGGAGGCTWHPGVHPPGDIVHTFTNTPNYYHVYKFSALYITCVQTKKGDCPGATKFYNDNEACFKGNGKLECDEAADMISGNDYNAVEGYFLTGYVPGMKGDCGDDIGTGVFTVHLDPIDP
jgi:hypothetical protein